MRVPVGEALVRFAETLKLRSLARATQDERHYSPSSMRTAVSAMRAFYGLHLGRDWKLFDLVRSPSAQRLPVVLTRAEVARFFSVLLVQGLGGVSPADGGWGSGRERVKAGVRSPLDV